MNKSSLLAFLSLPYVKAVLIVLGFLAGAKILSWLAQGIFKKMAKKTKTRLDDLIISKVKPPFVYFMVFIGLDAALKPLDLQGTYLNRIIDTVVIIAIMYMIKELIDVLLEVWVLEFAKKTKSKLDDSLLPLFQKFSKVLLAIISIVWALKAWGVDIGPFLASMGIAGVVLGFALKDSLANIFGGIAIILDRNLELGDKIQLESGELGLVQEVGLRSTKITTFDNELLVIPNGQMANSKIHNFTKPNINNRVTVEFGVEYGSDIKHIKDLAMDLVKKTRGIMSKPKPSVIFFEMGDFSLKFKVFFWVEDYNNVYPKKFEYMEKLYNRLNKEKIGIPYPTQTVNLNKPKECSGKK